MRRLLFLTTLICGLLFFSLAQAAPAPVWKTGQTIGKTAGDDGFLKRGISWPASRFSDLSDGTVKDNLTGLIWLKDGSCLGNDSWLGSLGQVQAFNNNATPFGCAGFTSTSHDWRLPNKKEMRSLIDYSQVAPALPQGHPFTTLLAADYWTSTTNNNKASEARYINFSNGNIERKDKSSKKRVWAVRSGLLPPAVDFIGDTLNGATPLAVHFLITNDSSAEIITWNWEFGDGSSSYEMQPTHSYAAAGTYSVVLTARGIGGEIISSKTNYITVIANITGKVTTKIGGYTAGLPVTNATIALSGASFSASASTDSQGNFTLQNIPSGTYTMVVTSPDFLTTSKQVTISQGQGITVSLPDLEVGSYTAEQVNTIKSCNYDFSIQAGWNLVSLAVNGAYTADSLSQLINANGGSVSLVMSWDGSAWQRYTVDAPFGDFGIEDQKGYFLFATEAAIIDFCLDPTP